MDALIEWVLDRFHFGDEVGEVDEVLVCSSACHYDLYGGGLIFDDVFDFAEVREALCEAENDLVEYYHVVRSLCGGGSSYKRWIGLSCRLQQELREPKRTTQQVAER